MLVDQKFWSAALIVVMVVVAGAGTLPALLLRPATSDTPELSATQTADPAEEPTAPAPGAPDSTASAAVVAEPAPVAAAKPAEPLTSWPTALPVAAEPPKRVQRPVAAEASPAPAPKAVAAAAKQWAFPPVQPIDAPAAAPRPAPGSDAAKKARQAQIAAAREAKRKRRVMRPEPYFIRDFFAATR